MSTRIRTRVAALSTGPAGPGLWGGRQQPRNRTWPRIDRISPKGRYLVKLRLHPNLGLIPASFRRWDFTPIGSLYPSKGGLAGSMAGSRTQNRRSRSSPNHNLRRHGTLCPLHGEGSNRPSTLNQYGRSWARSGERTRKDGRESREIVDYHPVRANSSNSIQRHEVGIKFAGSRIER